MRDNNFSAAPAAKPEETAVPFTRFESYEDLCRAIVEEILCALSKKPDLLLCIAAGHTSLGVFAGLKEAVNSGRADFSRAAFVAMDEWQEMSVHTPGSCGAFLKESFLNGVNFKPENIRLFDGTAEDGQGECAAVEDFITQRGGLDYLVLGSGMNGHLALNEPGTFFDSRAHVTALDPVSAVVGQKYFENGAELTGGLTLGIASFREAGRSVLMITGEHKREICQKILTGPIDPAVPATAVREFSNAAIFCDRAAGGWQ